MEPTPTPPPLDRKPYAAVGLSALMTLVLGVAALINEHEPFAVVGILTPPVAAGIICGLLVRDFRRNLKVTAIAVLVSCLAAAPVLREGAVCLVVILPAALVVTGLISALVALIARKLDAAKVAPPLALIPIAMLGWNATHEPLAVVETLEDSVFVAAPIEDVYASIERLDLDEFEVPAWTRWVGLPQPQRIEGRGASVGDVRIVRFGNGALRAEVVEADAPRAFRLKLSVLETGHEFIDHWCRLEDSVFEFHALPGGLTQIVHRTRYVPRTYPRFYFHPAEELFGHALQGTLLSSWAAHFERRAVRVVAGR